MIPETQLQEIRNLLEKSKNPLFYFNDDPDGLCSFLLLSKYIKKGKHVIVKSSTLYAEDHYIRKLEEIQPDLVVVLDEASLDQEFIEHVNCPILWIDHHSPKKTTVNYYNPLLQNPKDNRSTTYWAYQVTKQNLWLAAVGSLSDWQLTDITDKFLKKYPKYFSKKIKTPEQGLFETKLGELIKIFSLLLKGTTSEVRKSISILSKIESPEEILEQTTSKGNFLYKRAESIKKEYDSSLKKALSVKPKDKVLKFIYSPKTSFTSMLSNELLYKRPGNVIIVGRVNEGTANLSIRSPTSTPIIIPPLLKKSIANLQDATGGGHEHACGASIKEEDLEIFLERFRKEIQKVFKTKK
tara:strand:+ start:306 stop:1364 length:1059 start_codon:yes stop_codon:yes gene_type:complete